jgi:hypothetical protein
VTETRSEGGMGVTSISDGDWVSARGVDFGAAYAAALKAALPERAQPAGPISLA